MGSILSWSSKHDICYVRFDLVPQKWDSWINASLYQISKLKSIINLFIIYPTKTLLPWAPKNKTLHICIDLELIWFFMAKYLQRHKEEIKGITKHRKITRYLKSRGNIILQTNKIKLPNTIFFYQTFWVYVIILQLITCCIDVE